MLSGAAIGNRRSLTRCPTKKQFFAVKSLEALTNSVRQCHAPPFGRAWEEIVPGYFSSSHKHKLKVTNEPTLVFLYFYRRLNLPSSLRITL